MHYAQAREALINVLGHSVGAGGLAMESPPKAVFEGYNVVQSWREMAREYNARLEAEQRYHFRFNRLYTSRTKIFEG